MQITLHPREGAMLAPGAAVRVRCLAGVLWITSHHDSKDRLLSAGDSADLSAAQRQYLSSVGRNEVVAFEVTGPAASISVRRDGEAAFPDDGQQEHGWRRMLRGLGSLSGSPGLPRLPGLFSYLRQFV